MVTAVASASSATATSITPFAVCMPSETFSVATMRSEHPAMTALPAKHRPLTTAMRGTTPDKPAHSANARVSRAETTG